jgi:hypothetical protein
MHTYIQSHELRGELYSGLYIFEYLSLLTASVGGPVSVVQLHLTKADALRSKQAATSFRGRNNKKKGELMKGGKE